MKTILKKLTAAAAAFAVILSTPPADSATLDRTEAADYVIWKASAADASRQKGDALDASGNLTIGWTPDKSGETYVNINGVEFDYYISHTSENGAWDKAAGAAKGPSVKFHAPSDGVFTAYITNMNSAKTFYMSEGGGASQIVIDSAAGTETGSSFGMSINVESGKDYYAYVSGSKGSFCGAAFEPGAEIVPPVNLLTNGDFESGALSPFKGRSSVCGISEDSPHGGNYCAYVSGRSQTWTGIEYDVNDIIEEDGAYYVSVWIRLADNAPSDTDCNFYLQAELQESGRSSTYPIIDNQTAKTGQWIKLSGALSLEEYELPLSKAYIYICSSDTNTEDFYADDFEMYKTNAAGSQYPPITEFPTAANSVTEAAAEIDFNSERQEIQGFGASGAFGTAQSIKNLPDEKREEVMRLLFDAENGIGLTVLRNMLTPQIGAEEGVIDLSADSAQGWLMEECRKYGAEQIMTTCWTPPAWMKDNNSTIGGSLAAEHYQDFADYLADYIEGYRKLGIVIDIISPCNEPDLSPDYDGCTWTEDQLADFIKNYLKPTLTKRGLDTRILAAEEMRFRENKLSSVLSDKDAAAATDIFGVHGYDTKDFTHLTNVEATGKPLWMTEIMGYNAQDETMLDGLLWAKRIHQAVAQAGANEWNFWYLAHRFDGGNSAVIVLNKYEDDYVLPKRYYTIGNYSKYVRPGARRVDSTLIPNSDVYLSAYRNTDGKEIIVAENANVNSQTLTITLKGSEETGFYAYRTSETENLDGIGVSEVKDGVLTIELPPRSVTTYVNAEPDISDETEKPTEPAVECVKITAHYDEKGALVGLKTENITTDMITSDSEENGVKIFYWSSMSEMKPVKKNQ